MKLLFNIGFLLIALMGIIPHLLGQSNALILNGGYVVLNGGSTTNNVHLVVNQSTPQGIVRLPQGGHIVSESQYNFITWMSGNTTGNYIFPFGVGSTATNYIPFTFNKTAGNSALTVSTWGTNQQNSPQPLQSMVTPVTNMLGVTDSVLHALDRFWDIRATGSTADLTFAYLGTENTTSSPLSPLKMQKWDGTVWETPLNTGSVGVNAGVGIAGPVVGQTSFSPTVLIIDCPTAPIVSSNSPVCVGTPINLSAVPVDNATYSWTGPNGFTSSVINPIIDPATASMGGVYSLTVTVDGCTSPPSTINVVVTGGLNLTITPPNPEINQGGSVNLNVTGATNYTWSPAQGLSCTTCANPVASPLTTTTYTVTGTNAQGCSGTANVLVFVDVPCNEVFVPTIFSPNDDGANDLQCVFGNCISSLNYAIYNRWGELIFQTNSPNICWDGTYKDKPVDVGIYVYKLSVKRTDGSEIQKSGNLTLIR
jgi:gliding motility-associated-like protein